MSRKFGFNEIREQIVDNPDLFQFNREAIQVALAESRINKEQESELYCWLIISIVMKNNMIKSMEHLKQEYIRDPLKVIRALNEYLRKMNNVSYIPYIVMSEVYLDKLVHQNVRNRVEDSKPPFFIYDNTFIDVTALMVTDIIRVGKRELYDFYYRVKQILLETQEPHEIIRRLFQLIRHGPRYEENSGEWIRYSSKGLSIRECIDKRMCHCTQFSLLFQLFAQTCGLETTMVGGRVTITKNLGLDFNNHEKRNWEHFGIIHEEPHCWNYFLSRNNVFVVDAAYLNYKSKDLVFVRTPFSRQDILGLYQKDVRFPEAEGVWRMYRGACDCGMRKL